MKFFTKQNLKNKIKYLVAVGTLFLPLPAFAQQVQQGLNSLQGKGLFSGTGLAGDTSIQQLLPDVITILLFFAGAVAVIFVIIGGYQYLTSGGNEESAEKGKKTLINAMIGIVVIILSYVIISVVVNLVSSNNGVGF